MKIYLNTLGFCVSLFLVLLLVSGLFSFNCYSQQSEISWDASPQNWKNSAYNYDNSELNFRNSQANYLNQRSNPNRINIVNLIGVVTGYAVKKSDDGWNYFDNSGKRIGYSPDNGKTAYTVEGKPTKFSLETK